MVLSMGVFATSAADTENQVIYFEVPTGEGMLNWDGAKIYCHIWAYGGDSFAQWQSKRNLALRQTQRAFGCMTLQPRALRWKKA